MAKSIYDILNVGHGVLNPEYSSLTGKNHNAGEAGFFSHAVHTIKDTFGKPVKSTFKGPMVGICLRDDGRVSETGWQDPTCWAAASSEIVEAGSDLDLVQIKVRIPEIHGAIEIPKDLPSRNVENNNHDVINQYPTFISQFSSVATPSAGDLVWVDFQDRETQTGGIFLGVAEGGTYAAKSKSENEKKAKEEYEKRKKRSLLKGSKTSPPEDLFKYSEQYYAPSSVLTGPFPEGVVEGEESEEEFKSQLPLGLFKSNGTSSGKNYYTILKDSIKDLKGTLSRAKGLTASAKKVSPQLDSIAKTFPISLVAALIRVESNFNPNAEAPRDVSSATGLGQFLNSTATGAYEHDRRNPDVHIPMIVKYMASLFKIKENYPVTGIHSYSRGAGGTPRDRTEIQNDDGESPFNNPFYPEKILRLFHSYQTGEVFEDTPFGWTEYHSFRLDNGTAWLTSKGNKIKQKPKSS